MDCLIIQLLVFITILFHKKFGLLKKRVRIGQVVLYEKNAKGCGEWNVRNGFSGYVVAAKSLKNLLQPWERVGMVSVQEFRGSGC